MRKVKEEVGLDIYKTFGNAREKSICFSFWRRTTYRLRFFEAKAKLGQMIRSTQEAKEEGLEVRAFDINNLPEEKIMKDREKLEAVIATKSRTSKR